MQLFTQNISSLKEKVQESFQKWGNAIGSRNPKDAEKYAKELYERLNALYAYSTANLRLARHFEEHLVVNLGRNSRALQQRGINNISETSQQIQALERELRTFVTQIQGVLDEVKITIANKTTANPVPYENVERILASPWQTFKGMETLVTTDINTLAGDIRRLAKDKKNYKQFAEIIEEIIDAEKELKKLK